jgi:1-acyl-sn-glycerol-3-phosphate acyltransferase
MQARLRFLAFFVVGVIFWIITTLHGRSILNQAGSKVRLELSQWRSFWLPFLFAALRRCMRLQVRYVTPFPMAVRAVRNCPCIVVANHQSSLIDPIILPGLLQKIGLEDVRWAAKEGMKKAWGYGPMFEASGFAWLSRKKGDDNDIRSIEVASALAHAEGASMMIFPEGTRAPAGELLRPKAGGFKAIVRNMPGAPIVSVTFGWDRPPQGVKTILDGAPLFGRTVYVTIRAEPPIAEDEAEAWLNAEWERKRVEMSASVT